MLLEENVHVASLAVRWSTSYVGLRILSSQIKSGGIGGDTPFWLRPTAALRNVPRQLLDWLDDSYAKDSDRVDLLYATFNCHGWVGSDEHRVVVRLEPLSQPTRGHAQEQLYRKLTDLGARIPGGKWLRIEVGQSPL